MVPKKSHQCIIFDHYGCTNVWAESYLLVRNALRLVDSIRAMKGVKYVERDQIMKALQTECNLQVGATWGLVRTTLRDWNTNPNDPPNEYEHDKNGKFSEFLPHTLFKSCGTDHSFS